MDPLFGYWLLTIQEKPREIKTATLGDFFATRRVGEFVREKGGFFVLRFPPPPFPQKKAIFT